MTFFSLLIKWRTSIFSLTSFSLSYPIASITTIALWGRYKTKGDLNTGTVTLPQSIWWLWISQSTKWLMGERSVLDKGVSDVLGGTEQNGKRVHHVSKKTHNLIYDLFISGNFHIIFLDCSWNLQATENSESETIDEEDYCIRRMKNMPQV